MADRGDGKPGGPSFSVDSHYNPNTKCRGCGKWKFDKNRCRCAKPEWEPRIRHEAPTQYLAFQAWCEAWGREALRVTKPGGYLLAFGGTRTHHRLVCGLEDAGWIIRDELTWVYAQGFPKGKANLKPAHEPIVLARKPGPLRPLAIDAGRIDSDGSHQRPFQPTNNERAVFGKQTGFEPTNAAGRWPSNLLLSDPALFDEPNPEVVGSGAVTHSQDPETRRSARPRQFFGGMSGEYDGGYGDSGGYSRFFIIPKADRGDREPVLRGQLPAALKAGYSGGMGEGELSGLDARLRTQTERENLHPTVKPTDLMRHLIRLVTPARVTELYCAGCDSYTDLRPLRSDVRADSEAAVLLDDLQGSLPEAGEELPAVRNAVLDQGPDVGSAVLLQDMREPGGNRSTAAVRGVRDDVQAGQAEQHLLFEDLRSDGNGSAAAGKGMAVHSDGVHRGVEPDSSDGAQGWVSPAAPADSSRATGQDAASLGSGRSPERDQGRQSTGEPAGAVEEGPRQSAETATQADHLPALPLDDLPIGPCSACGGQLTARERRGVVLDPFGGSGSTALACELEGFDWILVEQDASYVAIAEARLNGVQRGLGLDVPAPTRQRTGKIDDNATANRYKYPGAGSWSKWPESLETPDEEPAA